MSLERLGMALTRVDDLVADACDEDLEEIERWLYRAEEVVGRERDRRRAANAEHTNGNAEDCPRCAGRRDLPYPFLCPGTDPTRPTEETGDTP